MEIGPIFSSVMRSKTGAVLVALQVAISLGILANALHIVQQRQAVAVRSSGIQDESAVFRIGVQHLVKAGHEEQQARQLREAAALRAVGGVTSVAWANQMPMTWEGRATSVVADPKQTDTVQVSYYASPDALGHTLGLKIVEGRDLARTDVIDIDYGTADPSTFPRVTLVTRALAAKLWPGAASVVGKTLYLGRGEDGNSTRVVGVIDTLQSHSADFGDQGNYALLAPVRMTNAQDGYYIVRAEAGQLQRVIREAESALRASSSTPVLLKTVTVAEDRARRYKGDRALSWMLVGVSLLLLLVTASGIVGMASLWVNQRRKQIGVRRALGARRVDILRYFLLENFMITSVGVGSGLLMALGLNALLVAQLGMERLPLGYLATGCATLWTLGLAAVYGPAWRAASISPATATRSI